MICQISLTDVLLTCSPTLPAQPPTFPLIWIGPSSVVTFLFFMSSGLFLLSFISIDPVDKLTSMPTGVFCNTAAASFSSLFAFCRRALACCKQPDMFPYKHLFSRSKEQVSYDYFVGLLGRNICGLAPDSMSRCGQFLANFPIFLGPTTKLCSKLSIYNLK